jgi:hypothetical protein
VPFLEVRQRRRRRPRLWFVAKRNRPLAVGTGRATGSASSATTAATTAAASAGAGWLRLGSFWRRGRIRRIDRPGSARSDVPEPACRHPRRAGDVGVGFASKTLKRINQASGVLLAAFGVAALVAAL